MGYIIFKEDKTYTIDDEGRMYNGGIRVDPDTFEPMEETIIEEDPPKPKRRAVKSKLKYNKESLFNGSA